jgi:hypothetical protein
VLVALYRRHRRRVFSLMLLGTGLLTVSLIITLSVNVPIDGSIGRWTVDTLPADWTNVRNRWEAYHTARTFACMAGFGCALVAAMWPPADRDFSV